MEFSNATQRAHALFTSVDFDRNTFLGSCGLPLAQLIFRTGRCGGVNLVQKFS